MNDAKARMKNVRCAQGRPGHASVVSAFVPRSWCLPGLVPEDSSLRPAGKMSKVIDPARENCRPPSPLARFVAGATLRTLLHSRLLGNGGLFLTFLGLTIASLRCFRFRFPLYGLGTLALPYFTLGVTSSMERFVLVCFPAFMCLAALCKQRPGSRIR